MTIQSLRLYAELLLRFRNGGSLIRALRGGPLCDVAVLRDGLRLTHPPGRPGLVDLLIEVWLRQPYTQGDFYHPKDGDVIIDVGANIGLFSIWLARQNSRCRVVALEPSPENYHYLEANLHAASLGPDRVEPHRLALGASSGSGRMIATSERSLDHRLELVAEHSEADAIRVITLSELFDLAAVDRIALLKVDIEGSERDAFEHTGPEMLGRLERIVVEYHDNLRPGTLALLQDRLQPTHDCVISPSGVDGCGILTAVRRSDPTHPAP